MSDNLILVKANSNYFSIILVNEICWHLVFSSHQIILNIEQTNNFVILFVNSFYNIKIYFYAKWNQVNFDGNVTCLFIVDK